MPTKKPVSKRKWIDPDEAPRLDADWFARAEIKDGDKVVRAGRPKSDAPKESINIRFDPDVIAHYRATGAGWQTRINRDLRKAAKLKA